MFDTDDEPEEEKSFVLEAQPKVPEIKGESSVPDVEKKPAVSPKTVH